MVRDKIRMRRRNEGCQFFYELQRTKYHGCRAVIPRPLQPIRHPTVRKNGKSVLGYGRSGNVPAQTFQPDSVMAINTGSCMQCEPLEPIGSASTLVAVTIIHKYRLPLSFMGFVKKAIPFAALQILLAVIYVLVFLG